MADTPAGWYPDPEQAGQQRYWDGLQWTEHRAPLEGGGVQQPAWGGQAQDWSAGQATWSQAANPAADVNTWLWQSIVASFLCCQPAGIVGIVFAAQANASKNIGDLATAREKARIARIWTLVAVGIVLAVIVLFLVFGVFGAIVDSSSNL